MGYDGSIRIVSKIETKDAEESLSSLEYTIKKSAKEIDNLRQKMDVLKDQKIPTQEYKKLQDKLSKAKENLENLISKQSEWENIGVTSGDAWDTLNQKIATASDAVDDIKAKMQGLSDAGKDFTLGRDTAEYASYANQIKYEEEAIIKAGEHYKALLKNKEGYEKIGSIAKSVFKSIGSSLKNTASSISTFHKSLKNIAQRIFPSLNKSVKKSSGLLSTFASRLRGITLSLFVFNWITKAFNALVSSIKDGFSNLYEANDKFKKSVDSLKTSAATLKNTLATAFLPIVEIAIPAIQNLINHISVLMDMVAQFMAAITGQKTYTKAIKQTTAAIEDQTKASNKQLSSLDKLNNLTSQSGADADSGAGTMFEEVPIDSSILNLADRFKDIFSQLFAPLKEAWNNVGQKVMEAWKFALDEVWQLIKDIGRDFLEVWNQPETISVLEEILLIIADIGLVIGNLAKNFREAWNYNETGKKILEGIRDIIGVIVTNILHAADATVEWAENLDFIPLLTKIQEWIDSLVPVFDNLSGIITDFYEQVLLPLGKWVLEKGLPELLQVFIDFNEKVDWESLRKKLSEFWDHLEPFAETVGEGLIIFIRDVSNALADFVNSETFANFLTTIESWMDKVDAKDVANALKSIATALLAFEALKNLSTVFSTITTFISFFGGSIANSAATTILTLSSALGNLFTVLAALGIVEASKNPIIELGEAAGMSAEDADYMRERYNGLSGDLRLVKDSTSILTNGIQGLGWEMSNQLGTAGALETAMNNIADGMIYTDDKLSKLQKNFGLTDEDIEMLRQSMLDMHPELRSIADTFDGLSDASVQTLQDIHDGFDVLSKTTGDYSFELEMMTGSQSEMTDEAKNFFMSMQEGTDYLAYYQSATENTSGAINTFDESIQSASENIQASSENIGNSVSEGMEQAKKSTDDACIGIKESVGSNLSETDKNVSEKLGSIKSTWFYIFESLKSKVASVFDSISLKITSVLDRTKSKIDELKSKFNSLFGGSIGISSSYSIPVPGVSKAFMSLSTVDLPDFPGYATGQVIPTNMKKHLAYLGDNNRETEVVSPLSTMKQALKEAVSELGGIGNNGDIVIQIDGREVFRVTQKQAREYKKQTGSPAFS